jgi:hypothetical protein
VFVFCTREAFRQRIGNLIFCWQVCEEYVSAVNLLPQEVVSDIDVFGPVMELWVLHNRDGRLVIDVEQCRVSRGLS